MKKYRLTHAMLLLFIIFSSTENFAQLPDAGPDPFIVNLTVPAFPKNEKFSLADSINNSRLYATLKNSKPSSESQLVNRGVLLATAVSSNGTKLLIMKSRTPYPSFKIPGF